MKIMFEDWMKQVDREIERIAGMFSGDLSDVCYRDWFDDGVSPARAAKRALDIDRADWNK